MSVINILGIIALFIILFKLNIMYAIGSYRDPDMISITSAPAAPAPRIRILHASRGDVETVRIGDRLIFRIEIPGNSKIPVTLNITKSLINTQLVAAPYGIFARGCVAMAKDSKSTFEIIDDDGYTLIIIVVDSVK